MGAERSRAATVNARPRFVKPAALSPGDRVTVVAPAGPLDGEAFDAGLRILNGRCDVAWDPGLLNRTRYLAGDDARRCADLAAALADPRTRAVVAARGGYGSMRLLARLWPSVNGRPASADAGKLLVGFSDITVLRRRATLVARAAARWATRQTRGEPEGGSAGGSRKGG